MLKAQNENIVRREFSIIKVRVAAAIVYEGRFLTMRRMKGGLEQFSLPGGNIEVGEHLIDALHRELLEELSFVLPNEPVPRLIAVQDQMVSRPGPTPPPRKLHFVFGMEFQHDIGSELTVVDDDEVGPSELFWLEAEHCTNVHLFPAVGLALRAFAGHSTTSDILLPPLTDQSFSWV